MNARRILSMTLAIAAAIAPQAARAQAPGAPAAVLPAPGGNAAAIAAQAVARPAPDSGAGPAGQSEGAAAPVATPSPVPVPVPVPVQASDAVAAPPADPPATPPSEAASQQQAPTTTVPTVVSEGGLAAPAALPRGLGIAAPGSTTASDAGDKPMALLAGLYKCELSRSVTIRKIAADGRSLVLNWAGRDHDFSAVEARTGALRFENVAEGMVWLVIIGKAMLLDTRKGKQLANECKH